MTIFRHGLLAAVSALTLVAVGCGGGSDGGEVASAGGSPQNPAPLPPGSATVTLRVGADVPGASPLAFDGPSRWNPLRWFSSPALAQSFFTIPGAKVDAVGWTFALADEQGRARFYGLPAQSYRFAVTSGTPSLVLQSLASVRPGQDVSVSVDETTTTAALMASLAANELNTDTGEADQDALTSALAQGLTPELTSALDLVERNLAGTEPWVDLRSLLPTSPELLTALEEANSQVTYRIQKTPLTGLASPTSTVLLTLTFNNALDPTSLPGTGTPGWSLQTPSGTVTQANLASSGVQASYSGEQTLTVDGRVVLPHTLYFVIPGGPAPAGVTQAYSLSLPSLPEDSQGRTILSSRPAGSFAEWSFVSSGSNLPGAAVESNVVATLDFAAAQCEGTSNADLSQVAAPYLGLASFNPGSLGFDYYDYNGQTPQTVWPPEKERIFQLRVESETSIQAGDSFPISERVTVSYQERDNSTGATRTFRASEGVVTILSVQDSKVTAEADVVMSADEESSASGSFCLTATFSATWP